MKKQQEITLYIYNLRNFLIEQKVFKNYKDMEYFFAMGGCYIFARILQRKFNLPLAISHGRSHCGMYLRTGLFHKVFFDIYGSSTNTYYGFKKCNSKDIDYIENAFGFTYYPSDNFEEKFIEEILEAFEKNEKPSIGSLSFAHTKCTTKFDTINEKASV